MVDILERRLHYSIHQHYLFRTPKAILLRVFFFCCCLWFGQSQRLNYESFLIFFGTAIGLSVAHDNFVSSNLKSWKLKTENWQYMRLAEMNGANGWPKIAIAELRYGSFCTLKRVKYQALTWTMLRKKRFALDGSTAYARKGTTKAITSPLVHEIQGAAVGVQSTENGRTKWSAKGWWCLKGNWWSI